ncbi:EamA family transporter RarD [Oceanobacillus sp. Castelsardo]|uniref:EamA family transporter RarD n=1 Tax=Oceanobacillus sp. Castelsardo TaxID=1851204 RepID=UPI00083887C4|nr:EamA family transporter RarD [Oceanobacillus sp. Castelsardo]
MNNQEKTGMMNTAIAYLLWGLIPLYWRALDHVPSGEILAQRILWSFVFMILLILFVGKWNPFMKTCKEILHNKKGLFRITLATLFISVNWLVFIWAVNGENVVQVSLGYYINPLISILLGIIVLKEKSSTSQNVSFILASIGVLYLTFSLGVFPWVSLVLAVTFAFYGLLKKKMNLNAMFGLAIETAIITPIALIYISFLPQHHFQMGNALTTTNWLFIGAGVVTAIPLLLFGSGAKYIPLAMVGILQYIAPTLMLMMGVFLFNEEFTFSHLIAFLFIWSALVIYMGSHMKPSKKRHKPGKVKQVQ